MPNEGLRKEIIENGRIIASRLNHERKERIRYAKEKALKEKLAEEQKL